MRFRLFNLEVSVTLKRKRYYAIYSTLIHQVVGYCTEAGAADAREPNHELRPISRKEYERQMRAC